MIRAVIFDVYDTLVTMIRSVPYKGAGKTSNIQRLGFVCLEERGKYKNNCAFLPQGIWKTL